MLETITLAATGICLAAIFFSRFFRRRRLKVNALLTGARQGKPVSHSQEWELYHNEQAPSQRIRTCLTELNIPHKSYAVTLQTAVNQTVPVGLMQSLSKHQIPLLLHHGQPIYNSRKQMAYVITQHNNGAQMLPTTTGEKSRLEYFLKAFSGLNENNFAAVSSAENNEIFTIALPAMGAILERFSSQSLLRVRIFNRFFRKDLNTPTLRGLTMLSIVDNPHLNDAFETAKEKIEAQLDKVEDSLSKHGKPWITGETFTQIDIELMVLLERLYIVTMLEDLLDARRPNTRLYWKTIKSKESYRKSILNHRSADIKAARIKILATRATNSDFDETLRVNH